ncbi:hypothetical protein Focb16_v011502 [Fusarium oxysporum f. sp. cubense]|uniref:Uncharacterized protein n=1 Tax=Fusarium oxysporum f. sp. cubense TaxID=61366 RepID=A0A559LDV6_FUSOC|nr:hypothetical protein Focb16_v011502 [Fusarium oxysporum f. sp. cubense]
MAINGLLASLIYLDDTRSSATHVPNAELRDMARWQAILDFRIEVEQYWDALTNITQTEDLPGLDSLLKAFPTPVHLYEAAIFTFRNTLTGPEPDSLENIFAICSLSYVTSICSRRTGKPDIDNIFRDINIWRDSIGDPQHRQLFNDLIQRLWGVSAVITTFPFQTEKPLHSASQYFNGPYYLSPQSATMQDISLFGDFPDPFWGGLLDVPGSLPGPNVQMTGTAPGSHPTVFDARELQLPAGALRQSAVMNILTSFLANCGDLMDILSGHGATVKGPHSDVSKEVKNFARALRRHESFEEPSARGILAIVDRFVGLDYFQSIEEIRDYIIIVAKEILPSGKPFAEVCKSIYLSTDMTKMRPVGRRQHADRALDRKLDAISAVDGLLACLIYLKTDSEMTDPFVHDLCHHIDRYWERLGQISSTQTTPNLTTLLNSFKSSTQFHEVAIFTFRNVLVGAKPDSLNAIFSLCSLSYIASCYLRNYDNFRAIEVWQNAIRDPQEREVFINLAGVVWPQVSLISIDDTLNSQMPTVIRLGASTQPNAATQSSALGFDFMRDEWLFNDLSNAVWELDAMPDSSVTIGIENLQRTSSTLEDLQGSAIVSNLICFLTECGDLLHVFSGRGVTTKDLYSCIAFTQGGSEAKNLVNSCIQRLKSDDSSQNPCTAGIASIVERFVALGYLQTPEELRKYMLYVGRRVIVEDEAFAKFCQSVCESTATVTRPATPPRGGGRRRGLGPRLTPGR